MIGYIYKIVSDNTQMCYIGSTIQSLEARWSEHKCRSANSPQQLYKHIREHGVENFKIQLIKSYEVCDKAHLSSYEQLYINRLNDPILNINNPWGVSIISCKPFGKLYKKNYNLRNRQAILTRKCEKVTCECGIEYTRANKTRHMRTARHERLLSPTNVAL